MTSEQLKDIKAMDISTNAWLREIALLLAQLNEKRAPQPKQPKDGQ